MGIDGHAADAADGDGCADAADAADADDAADARGPAAVRVRRPRAGPRADVDAIPDAEHDGQLRPLEGRRAEGLQAGPDPRGQAGGRAEARAVRLVRVRRQSAPDVDAIP